MASDLVDLDRGGSVVPRMRLGGATSDLYPGTICHQASKGTLCSVLNKLFSSRRGVKYDLGDHFLKIKYARANLSPDSFGSSIDCIPGVISL